MKHINYFLIAVLAICATGCQRYYQHQGSVFGTYYNIQYKASKNMDAQIQQRLAEFDASLSMYNPASTISRINANEEVETDPYFERMYETASYVSEVSQGGFDITVAPLVNAWGFGFKHKENVTQAMIDSLLQFIGYQSIRLENHRIIKSDPRTMMDASALAKGYACDVVAELLAENGSKNYLVDIGGEVVVKGNNRHLKPWTIGITKPIDDPTGEKQELQDIIETSDLCMATSGNYRNYYFEDGVRRSHTIDPRTGYPVHHKLLSATIIAPTCMQADALATACMVLGEYQAAFMINQISETAYFFILTDDEGNMTVKTSPNWDKLLHGEDSL
ncbi:MAG: FAD:protein FMN transferase [Paludibacteraceae bacterium]|nr:FAD:protein FMN transferase [Paludibacteraceae bacterium]